MTVRIIESFDWLTTTTGSRDNLTSTMSKAGWIVPSSNLINTFSTAAVETGRFGVGKCLRADYDNTTVSLAGFGKYAGAPKTEGIIACSIRVNTTGDQEAPSNEGGGGVWFHNSDAILGCHIGVTFERFGKVKVYRGNDTTLGDATFTPIKIAESDPDSYVLDSWLSLQVRAVISDTAGQVEVKINDKVILSLVDEDTKCALPIDGTFDFACFGGMGTGGYGFDVSFDDFYFMDTAGSVNNDFLGNLRVKSQFVIADGSNIESTIGGSAPAATHWQSVNNLALDDTKYVEEPTLGDFDVYDLDPNLENAAIHAVQIRIVGRQDDATQMAISPKIKTTVGYDLSPEVYNLYQIYTHMVGIWELNPDTGVSWTSAEVNGLEAGFEVVTPEA